MDYSELAARVSQNWDLANTKPQLLKQRENAVFKIHLQNGDKAVLRIHRPDYHDDAAIESELNWLIALGNSGLEVPIPVADKNGRLLASVKTSDRAVTADVLTWIEGIPLGEDSTLLTLGSDELEIIFGNLGQTTARLHEISDQWQPPENFKRHAWNLEGLLGEEPFWGRFWELEELTFAQRQLLMQARQTCKLLLQTFSGSYGLIHADLVRENVLVENGQTRLIDFDDAGYGWRVFEIATLLFKNRFEPKYDVIKKAYLNGYRQIRTLSEQELDSLPLFELMRSFTYLGWAQDRRNEPETWARIPNMITSSCELAEDFLTTF